MSQNNILELRNLRKVFNRDLFKKPFTAIDSLTCVFPQGQCVGFMGHNGAGKTTTIRMIFGLIKPDQGQVLFNGAPMTLEDRKRIGYMPEINKLPLNLTSEEILRHQLYVFRPNGIPKSQYKEVIEKSLNEVGLWNHRRKRIGQFSKGMGRRLAWAKATIHKPDLLILDEPFSGLDPLGYQLMSGLIENFRQEKKSIILCTHELWSINQVCDHLYIINQGKIVYSSFQEDQAFERKSGYLLNLSGCSLQDLERLRTHLQLQSWSWSEESGYTVKLWFHEYPIAASWLSRAPQEGFIVTNFQKTHGFQEEELLSYFKGERTA